MRVYIGTDHNGYQLKQTLVTYLAKKGHEVIDDGDTHLDPADDFPVFASRLVASLMTDTTGDAKGILICGSGQGMCIAANRYKGIRACLGYDVEAARSSRNDDDSNVLCLPARTIKTGEADRIVDAWLTTEFAAAPRFIRRIREIDEFN